MNGLTFNRHGVWAIYKFEMARTLRTLWQSLVTPVITTSLYSWSSALRSGRA
jgi:ABC-2 type transport system permease protein